jgi:pantoate--beta-alanine ligase
VIVCRTIAELRRVLGAGTPGRRAFVPTMGALHAGHTTLFRRARAESDQLVASIFVNPKQFSDAADLSAYPRPEARDLEMAADAGGQVMFIPAVDEMYPPDGATSIAMAGPALDFEGAHRPGHFNGVALVCLALFHLVRPDAVYLGQKDAQQVAVLRRLTRDLHLAIDIVVVPTVREPSGLALSSRNVRLSADDRTRAAAIPRALAAAVEAHRSGGDPVAAARARLAALAIDYLAVAAFDQDPTLVVAVRVGGVRLIDNVPLEHPDRAGLIGTDTRAVNPDPGT